MRHLNDADSADTVLWKVRAGKERRMSVEIKWIHHASFRLSDGDNVLYIDPWKLPDDPHDADAVFVSHDHFDHCSPEDIEKVGRDDTVIVAPESTLEKLHDARGVTPGENIYFKDILIEAVAAYNVSKTYHPHANNWCGAVFTIAGKRIYYAGDTDLIDEMSELTDVDVALLPIGGTYTLSAQEAARACERIGCLSAVGYHWGDIVGDESDLKQFAESAPCKVHVLKPGECVTV